MNQISANDRAVLNCIFNPMLPLNDNYEEDLLEIIKDDNEKETEIVKNAKALELEGVKCAEKGELQQALKHFTEAIHLAPLRSSGYNNRAQAYRLCNNDTNALNDLNKAIELSQGLGQSGCKALCQRGLLHRKSGDQDSAKEDFTRAAQLGSPFAKQQLVAMNPYAAMCNQMLHDMISSLKEEKTKFQDGA